MQVAHTKSVTHTESSNILILVLSEIEYEASSIELKYHA